MHIRRAETASFSKRRRSCTRADAALVRRRMACRTGRGRGEGGGRIPMSVSLWVSYVILADQERLATCARHRRRLTSPAE